MSVGMVGKKLIRRVIMQAGLVVKGDDAQRTR